jgi:hypothetical protein
MLYKVTKALLNKARTKIKYKLLCCHEADPLMSVLLVRDTEVATSQVILR